jgi:valyl-tRNA synthetase
MDPPLNLAVNEAFIRMHKDGTIYRANRLVNWCTKLKTALSNLEVLLLINPGFITANQGRKYGIRGQNNDVSS